MGNSSSSSGGAPKITAQDKAILDLKNQRDKLHQYQKRIQTLTSREQDLAKEALRRRDKKAALLALRRKKYQESLLSKTDAQLMQLERLTQDVEFALVQKDIVFGLQQGTAVLKEIHREMGGIDAVDKLVGESEDERRYQDEVSELLSGKLTNDEEDEVDAELERLEAAALPKLEPVSEDRLPSPPQVVPPPAVPVHTPEKGGRTEDAMLA